MSALKNTLQNTGLFEVVADKELNDSGAAAQCIGRMKDSPLWMSYMQQVLLAEAAAIEKEELAGPIFSFSKFYFVDGGVKFMWKIVCADTSWFDRHSPPVQKADWSKDFKVTMAPDGFPEKVSLVSATGKGRIASPADLGIGGSNG